MASVFSRTGSVKPKRSLFDLSHEVKMMCNAGDLIPVLVQEMVPGDSMKFGNELLIRLNPLIHPIMHEINAYIHYYFVPTRLLYREDEVVNVGTKKST
ncbi:MAG: hypothetical protein Ta2A_11240 [Treponemataceae bacterium]|nr:MAG: hypothetical protein Ta2A_11240 [Treponemataceae bacterium]